MINKIARPRRWLILHQFWCIDVCYEITKRQYFGAVFLGPESRKIIKTGFTELVNPERNPPEVHGMTKNAYSGAYWHIHIVDRPQRSDFSPDTLPVPQLS